MDTIVMKLNNFLGGIKRYDRRCNYSGYILQGIEAQISELLENEGILKERVDINTRSLTPEEAIGITERRDFPIITGKE